MLIKRRPAWALPDSAATPPDVFFERRRFLGAASGLALGALVGPGPSPGGPPAAPSPSPAGAAGGLYPAPRNPRFALDRPLTQEQVAARLNVFDEFSVHHEQVWKLAASFPTAPWTVHVGGLVSRPVTFDVDELVRRLGLEERLYRHRCVETWAMAVPWTGFAFQKLVELVQPAPKARFVRMLSFSWPRPPGWHAGARVFPYYEGLSLAEATNELAFLATGIYGHPLPPQHGAPLRLVVPWKYGLKSIKSIVAFQFTQERPGTFWNELSPGNYSFECNVDPLNFPGPWSQKDEQMLGTGEVRPTVKYNGYGEYVARLYE